ncbi:hypothetical protein Y1Q_0022138 [Alligator mississippiensis]|uniref:Uncharacterized protein n=1 Tax=Alligator mississippiensis TaxID=8496 RepID=A0A151PG73_ALLMI|nr:hypothetical protein Y1Q_0022138 [Alligator mississippiensis]
MLLRSGSEESVVLFLLRTELACLREGSAARDSVRCKPLIHLEKQAQLTELSAAAAATEIDSSCHIWTAVPHRTAYVMPRHRVP